METTAPPVRFEPLTLGMLLDRAFRLYVDNIGLMIGISAIANVPNLVVSLVSALVLPSLIQSAGTDGGGPSAGMLVALMAGFGVWLVLFMLWAFIVVPLGVGATTKAVSESYLGNTVSIGEAYQTAKSALLRLLTAQFVAGVVVGLGTLLFVIPGILWFLSYSVLVPVVILESLGGREGTRRSWNLVADNRGRIFNVLFVIFLLQIVVGVAVGYVAGISGSLIVQQLASSAVQIGMFPMGAIAATLLYYDLRIRKEGFDLEMLRKQLETAG